LLEVILAHSCGRLELGVGRVVCAEVSVRNVPGGTGLVASLEEASVFRAALEAARSRVDGRCGCAADTSCYGCLRSYANQFLHASLARGTACDHLSNLLAPWPEA